MKPAPAYKKPLFPKLDRISGKNRNGITTNPTKAISDQWVFCASWPWHAGHTVTALLGKILRSPASALDLTSLHASFVPQ